MAKIERFGALLSDAIHIISRCEGKTITAVQDDLGYALGRKGGSAIVRWRQGHLPPTLADKEKLARLLIQHSSGRLNRAWLDTFLTAMKHPHKEDICQQLFPTATPPSPPTTPPTAPLSPSLPLTTIPEPGPLPPGSNIPFRPNTLFVGRQTELRTLAQALDKSMRATNQTVATIGLGGIGKTQLVGEFAHRYGRYFPGGVFWFNFEQPETIPNQIAACGGPGMLDLHPDFNDLKLADQIKIVQKEWQKNIRRLLIFDGCEEEAALIKWRPAHGGGCVLLTSRRGQWSPGLGLTLLRLDVFNREESVALLRQLQAQLPPAEANEIAQELGDLPLALHLAGSFLRAFYYHITPATYLNQLRNLRGGNLLKHPSLQGWATKYSPTGHECHVARIFALSYERLDTTHERDVLAQTLLARAVHFAPNESIPYDLLRATVAQFDQSETESDLLLALSLKRLVALGLVSEDANGAVRLHQLITEFVKGLASDQTAQMEVEKAILNQAEALNKTKNPAHLRQWQAHLRYVTDMAHARNDLRASHLAYAMGEYLLLNGEYSAAQPYYEYALSINEHILGAGHPQTACNLNALGVLSQARGKYMAAKSYYEQALAIVEKEQGPNHPHVARSLNSLGTLLQTMGHYTKAKRSLERAWAIRTHTLGEEHPDTAESINDLGLLLQAMGDYAGAKIMLERALQIFEKVLGPEHPYTAGACNNLGNLLRATGDYAAARTYYEQALTIRSKVLGADHPDMAQSWNNLGNLFKVMGDYASAKRYYEQAFLLVERVLGTDHAVIAYPLQNLGQSLQYMGDLAGAQPYLERALAIREKALGPDNPLIAQSLIHLGHLYQAMGLMSAAQKHYQRALTIQQQLFGANHPDTARTLNQLGVLLRVAGELEKSRQHLEQALVIQEQRLGRDHLHTATTLYELGMVYQAMGDPLEAAVCFKRALATFAEILGPTHEKTQVVQGNLHELQEV